MEIGEYIKKAKSIQNDIIEYASNDEFLQNYQNSLEEIGDLITINACEEIKQILKLLAVISYNHQRSPSFLRKVSELLIFLKDKIKRSVSNIEIFTIFHQNKRILLFLLDTKIIDFDKQIINSLQIHTKSSLKHELNDYIRYFAPEINNYYENHANEKIDDEIIEIHSDFQSNFEENRLLGENDNYICSLIRNDSVEEFVAYVNKTSFSIVNKIQRSVFETNSFLIDKDPSLIEYAAFFGSIQIFQYLRLNGFILRPSLWLYAIHSNNAELIHLLEEHHVEPEDKTYKECFEESIKCHHNEIAQYIKENYLYFEEKPLNFMNQTFNLFSNIMNSIKKNVTINEKDKFFISKSLKYHNFTFLDNNLINNVTFYYSCKYGYYTLVELLLKDKSININAKIILNCIFNSISTTCFFKFNSTKQKLSMKF